MHNLKGQPLCTIPGLERKFLEFQPQARTEVEHLLWDSRKMTAFFQQVTCKESGVSAIHILIFSVSIG